MVREDDQGYNRIRRNDCGNKRRRNRSAEEKKYYRHDCYRKSEKTCKFSFGSGVKDKDIVIFTRQFATMIDAGLPLVQALDILSTQVENKTLSKTLVQVKVDVESGATYADALKKHPRIFSELYVNMVAAGEAGGILDTILNRLAAYIEKAMKLKKKVKGAMVYPACRYVDRCSGHCRYHDLCRPDIFKDVCHARRNPAAANTE